MPKSLISSKYILNCSLITLFLFTTSYNLLVRNFSSTNTPSNIKSIAVGVESPFKDEYGYYCLEDSGNSINDYLTSIPLDFSYEDKTILLKAPYLTYTSSEHRYYQGTVVDTIEGTTYLDTRDTWSLAYNDQPYVKYVSDISLKAYRGDNYISDLSITLSGNSASTSNKYYLQDLLISTSIPSNVTSVKLFFNNVYYSSSYHEVSSSQDYYDTKHYDNLSLSVDSSSNSNPQNTASVTVQFYGVPSGYSTTKFTLVDNGRTVNNYVVESVDYSTHKVVWRLFLTKSGFSMWYTFNITTRATFTHPDESIYQKTITTTDIDGPATSNISTSVGLTNLYWYPSYFLETINCSGRGDASDQAMVTSNWSSVKEYFLLLPNEYQTSFSNGTLDDPKTTEALTRYDYVVFYKNYGLEDFASRGEITNRYYSNKDRNLIISKEGDVSLIVIIIASLVSIISITTLAVIIMKKKLRN